MIVVTDKLSTESFHAFIDEQLNDEQYLQVEAQLDEIPEKVEEIQQCQIINERLREVFDPIVEEQIPEDLYELALYGIISEYQDDTDDYQQYGYEFDEATNTVTGFNDEITSPLDSFDTALELQDENFIDDDEFSELEQLSATGDLNLADFDIDNIRDDAGNILPDIFSEEEKAAYAASQPVKSAEELSMLDEIGSLSLEPLEGSETQDSIAPNQDAFAQTIAPEVTDPEFFSDEKSDDNFEEAAPELEQEPLEQSNESLSLEPQIPDLEAEIPAAIDSAEESGNAQKQKRILDTLEASEDLSLEPLEGEQPASVSLPEHEEHGYEESAEPDTTLVTTAASEQEAEDIQVASYNYDESDHATITEGNASPDFALPPEAGQGELFVDTTPPAVETEIKQATTENQSATRTKIIKPGVAAEASEFPFDEIVEQLDEIPDGNEQAPSDVVAEFFAENKAEPDFEVSEVVKQFEEVADEFDHHYDQEPFDSPVAHIKQKADDVLHSLNTRFSALKKTFNRNDEFSPDFNKAPPSFHVAASQPEISEQTAVPLMAEERLEVDNVEFETEFDDDENSEGLSRKIGDTLKFYKERLSQGQTVDEISSAGNHIVPHVELTGFEKYKRIIGSKLEQVSPENRMTIGGAILLVIGLVIGGSVSSIFEQPVSAITPEKVEQLAIDAHILYTQQNQDFAGNPSTSITESMQWLSARIGRQIRLADVQLEDFKQVRAIVMPTMASYATANIFENKNGQSITLLISAAVDPVANSPLACRVPAGVDAMCSWVKDSVSYVAVANLSLSRVRAFSQALADSL